MITSTDKMAASSRFATVTLPGISTEVTSIILNQSYCIIQFVDVVKVNVGLKCFWVLVWQRTCFLVAQCVLHQTGVTEIAS